jgi:hypothetical protein
MALTRVPNVAGAAIALLSAYVMLGDPSLAACRNLPAGWKCFCHQRYPLAIAYPPGLLQSLDATKRPEESAVISLHPAGASLPLVICISSNPKEQAPYEFFREAFPEHRNAPPFEFCAGERSEVIRRSRGRLGGRPAIFATVQRRDRNDMCAFATTKDLRLAICVPAENPNSPTSEVDFKQSLTILRHIWIKPDFRP